MPKTFFISCGVQYFSGMDFLVFQGVFEKTVCLTWFFCGEFVVDCGMNVVLTCTVLRVENFPLFLNLFSRDGDPISKVEIGEVKAEMTANWSGLI